MTREFSVASHELSMLAKQHYFDEPCMHYYDENATLLCVAKQGMYSWIPTTEVNRGEHPESNICNAPTFNQLKMWLWEKHKIWIEVCLWGDGIGFTCSIKYVNGKEKDGSTIVRLHGMVDCGLSCSSPEYALEKGLFEAIKLIK